MSGPAGAGSAAGIFGVRRKPARSVAGRLLWEIRLSRLCDGYCGQKWDPACG